MTANDAGLPHHRVRVDATARQAVSGYRIETAAVPGGSRFELRMREDGLELVDSARPRFAPLRVDFSRTAAARRLRQGDPLLRRATRLRGVRDALVVDATAGLGGDSLMLAGFGFRVIAVERCPIVAALLADGLRRAQQLPWLAPWAARVELWIGDAARWLEAPPLRPDMVYLDPMFAAGRRALPGRQMQLLADLVGSDADAPDLLARAQRVAARRVVVKRATRAPALAPGSSGCVGGKQVRYDLYRSLARN